MGRDDVCDFIFQTERCNVLYFFSQICLIFYFQVTPAQMGREPRRERLFNFFELELHFLTRYVHFFPLQAVKTSYNHLQLPLLLLELPSVTLRAHTGPELRSLFFWIKFQLGSTR